MLLESPPSSLISPPDFTILMVAVATCCGRRRWFMTWAAASIKPSTLLLARLVLGHESVRLGRDEREMLAFMTLYHRDGLPRLGDEKLLRDHHDRPALRKVLALLRAADALDSRSLESPQLVFALRKRKVHVGCYLRDLSSKARRVYLRRKKFRLLEEELGCTVEVDVRSVEALTLVA